MHALAASFPSDPAADRQSTPVSHGCTQAHRIRLGHYGKCGISREGRSESPARYGAKPTWRSSSAGRTPARRVVVVGVAPFLVELGHPRKGSMGERLRVAAAALPLAATRTGCGRGLRVLDAALPVLCRKAAGRAVLASATHCLGPSRRGARRCAQRPNSTPQGKQMRFWTQAAGAAAAENRGLGTRNRGRMTGDRQWLLPPRSVASETIAARRQPYRRQPPGKCLSRYCARQRTQRRVHVGIRPSPSPPAGPP